jgi:hypothetical protein
VSETSSHENNARVEAVTRMSTEKSGCDWTGRITREPLNLSLSPRIPDAMYIDAE